MSSQPEKTYVITDGIANIRVLTEEEMTELDMKYFMEKLITQWNKTENIAQIFFENMLLEACQLAQLADANPDISHYTAEEKKELEAAIQKMVITFGECPLYIRDMFTKAIFERMGIHFNPQEPGVELPSNEPPAGRIIQLPH